MRARKVRVATWRDGDLDAPIFQVRYHEGDRVLVEATRTQRDASERVFKLRRVGVMAWMETDYGEYRCAQ